MKSVDKVREKKRLGQNETQYPEGSQESEHLLEEIVLEGQERDYMKSVSVSAKGRTKKPSCEEDI